MSSRLVLFDHTNTPTLSKGARLTAGGIGSPKPTHVGNLAASGSGPSALSSVQGIGQMGFDAAGRMYVADTNNARVVRYTYNVSTQSFAYDSELSMAGVFGAGALVVGLVIIGSRLYLCASNFYTAFGWVYYWDGFEALWPGLTSANKTGSFGENLAAEESFSAVFTGRSLAIGTFDGNTIAIAHSDTFGSRGVMWKVDDGSFLVSSIVTGSRTRFAIAGGKIYGGGQQSTGHFPGVYEYNDSLLGVTALSIPHFNNGTYRKQRISVVSSAVQIADVFAFGSVLFGKESQTGRLHGWKLADNSYLGILSKGGHDEAALVNNVMPGQHNNEFSDTGRLGAYVSSDPLAPEYLAVWATTAPFDSIQSYVKFLPTSTAVAEWVFTDWSSSGNAVERLFVPKLDASNARVSLKKNALAFVPLSLDAAQSASAVNAALESAWGAGENAFEAGDTLTVKLELNTFFHVDGSLAPAHAREAVEDAGVFLVLEENESTVVPFGSGAARARVAAKAAARARFGT